MGLSVRLLLFFDGFLAGLVTAFFVAAEAFFFLRGFFAGSFTAASFALARLVVFFFAITLSSNSQIVTQHILWQGQTLLKTLFCHATRKRAMLGIRFCQASQRLGVDMSIARLRLNGKGPGPEK